MLCSIVSLVDERARSTDLLFRIGGEEFVLFLPDTREDDAVVVAESIRALVADAAFPEAQGLSVSVGVGELRQDESLDTCIKHADDALYRAKENGRNQIARRSPPDGAPGLQASASQT